MQYFINNVSSHSGQLHYILKLIKIMFCNYNLDVQENVKTLQ